MKGTKMTILITGLISIAATVIFYLLIFDNIFISTMRWVTLLFLLLSEAIVILKAIFVEKSIIASIITATGGVHVLSEIILSVIFANTDTGALETYILLNVLILCVLATVDLAIMHFAKKTVASDKKMAQNRAVMDACFEKAQGLAVIYVQSDYAKDLAEIAELIRYSDNSELTDDEAAIMGKLGELEAQLKEGSENVPALIVEVKNAINLRTIKMKSIKRGGY